MESVGCRVCSHTMGGENAKKRMIYFEKIGRAHV